MVAVADLGLAPIIAVAASLSASSVDLAAAASRSYPLLRPSFPPSPVPALTHRATVPPPSVSQTATCHRSAASSPPRHDGHARSGIQQRIQQRNESCRRQEEAEVGSGNVRKGQRQTGAAAAAARVGEREKSGVKGRSLRLHSESAAALTLRTLPLALRHARGEQWGSAAAAEAEGESHWAPISLTVCTVRASCSCT